MKVIEPTPSQAVTVLKKYFQSLGFGVTASQVQEGYARSRGYANWLAYVSENDPRGRKVKQRGTAAVVAQTPTRTGGSTQCRQCGSELNAHGLCTDKTCPYEKWPQQVELDDMHNMSTEQLEAKYGVKAQVSVKEALPEDGSPEQALGWSIETWLATIDGRLSAAESKEEELGRISGDLFSAMFSSKALLHYRHQAGRGEQAFEGDTPFLQISFDRQVGPHFAIELVLTLRDNTFAVYVDTYEFYGATGQQYRRYDEESGFYQETVNAKEYESLEELLERGAREVRAQFDALAKEFALEWT